MSRTLRTTLVLLWTLLPVGCFQSHDLPSSHVIGDGNGGGNGDGYGNGDGDGYRNGDGDGDGEPAFPPIGLAPQEFSEGVVSAGGDGSPSTDGRCPAGLSDVTFITTEADSPCEIPEPQNGIIQGSCHNFAGCHFASAYWVAADLMGSNFTFADLGGARLRDTDLSGADLSDADLTDADLRGAKLIDASLARANLSGARLTFAALTNANLANADLTDANLADAILTNADLTGANLAGADLSGVLWSNTMCPDGTNSDDNGGTCDGHLLL